MIFKILIWILIIFVLFVLIIGYFAFGPENRHHDKMEGFMRKLFDNTKKGNDDNN